MKIILLICAFALSGGCVSKSKMVKALDDVKADCNRIVDELKADIERKNERLSRFNQVKPDGSLR